MKEFLEFVIRQLIEFPDDMVLTEIPNGRTTVFKLQLRRGDVGRVIGRGGQTIQAIRALLASSAARHGQRAILEIVEHNTGHFLIGEALFVGLPAVVARMRAVMEAGRRDALRPAIAS